MSLAPPPIDVAVEPVREAAPAAPFGVVDLFSGAGGMSCGFHRHPRFAILGAADAEVGKPSAGRGTLGCNASYAHNIGVVPVATDLSVADPLELAHAMGLTDDPVVLSACAPCTGFTRTLSRNHVVDDTRNSLVRRVADFAQSMRPEVIVMENARELLTGRFVAHFDRLHAELTALGYRVGAEVHFLSDFGLPQRRERALIVAVRRGLPLLGLSDVWAGLRLDPAATSVRRAIAHLPALAAGESDPDDPMHVSPGIPTLVNQRRLAAIPRDGGSWADLVDHPDASSLLTPGMLARVAAGKLGSHPDVYGRMAWDRPAATIKRECGHIGNGRYAHPDQDRLLTVREMGLLQGFPSDYVFRSNSLANRYRHIGDAVPPMIAFQLAALVDWILGGERPSPDALVMPGSTLRASDITAI